MRARNVYRIAIGLWVLSIGGCGSLSMLDPNRIALPYDWHGSVESFVLNEPSGIIVHPTRGTLFAIGDEGDIAEITREGDLLRRQVLRPGADLEGLAVVPQTGLLYVAVEGEDAVLEVDPEDFAILRRFALPRSVGGEELLKPGGQGIEAICYVPNSAHPHGGTFYVANQSFTLEPGEERSLILQVELPLNETDAEQPVRVLSWFAPGIIDISGLHYDRVTDRLLALSDAQNMLLEFEPGGRLLRAWAVAGANQEGIAMDGEGMMYIAQDSGGIIRIRPHWPKDRR